MVFPVPLPAICEPVPETLRPVSRLLMPSFKEDGGCGCVVRIGRSG